MNKFLLFVIFQWLLIEVILLNEDTISRYAYIGNVLILKCMLIGSVNFYFLVRKSKRKNITVSTFRTNINKKNEKKCDI